MTIKEKQQLYKIAREKVKNLDEIIVQSYQSGQSMDKISINLGCGRNWIFRTLQRLHIKRRDLSKSHVIYKRDKDFFKKIDRENNAYFLGFLYADGNVIKNILQVCLHPQDIDILEKLKIALKTDQPIRNDRIYKRFNLTDTDIVSDLRKLGCVDRKTFIIKFPDNSIVPDHLIRHFVRGYFDGDSCLTSSESKVKTIKRNNISWRFGIDSCYDFAIKFKEIVAKNCELNQNNKMYPNKRRENPTYNVAWGSTKVDGLKRIFDYLYIDATVFSDRKKNIFLRLLKTINERKLWFKETGVLGEEEKNRRIKIMIENADKPIRIVADIIGIHSSSLAELYQKWNIPRTICKRGWNSNRTT